MACNPSTEADLVRLLLTEAVVGRKVAGREALDQLRALRDVKAWSFLADDVTLADPELDARILMGRQQVTDIQLVHLAARHGATPATFDTGIRRALAPGDQTWVDVWSL